MGLISVTKASKVATESLRRPASAGRRFFVYPEYAVFPVARDIGD
jgi:hypothetical protein